MKNNSLIRLTHLARCARRFKQYMDQQRGPAKSLDWVKEAPGELAGPMDLRVLRVMERPGGRYQQADFTPWELLPALPPSPARFSGVVESLPPRPYCNVEFSPWEFLEGVANDADNETL